MLGPIAFRRCKDLTYKTHRSIGTPVITSEFLFILLVLPLTAVYKKSCADYFRAGDHESGPKMIDIDGSGPLPAAHVDCDYA